MALYFSVKGSSGAALVANLKGTLDDYPSAFMLMTWPPYLYQDTSDLVYRDQALGWATIPMGAFVLSGNELVYTPFGSISVRVNHSGRVNWFALEVPVDSRNVIYWPGNGESLVAGQIYLVRSIRIPLALPS